MAGYDPKQPRDKEGQWTDSGEELAAENEAADARSSKRKELQATEMEQKRKATEARIAELNKELEDAKASGEDQFVIDRIQTELNREKKRLGAIKEETSLDITATAAREAAGLAEVDFHQQRMQLIEKARNEAGLSKGQMQGWERVRISKDYGGGSGFIYELSSDVNTARIHKKPDGQGEFLGYYHLSSLLPFK